jgi:hypothetical protein
MTLPVRPPVAPMLAPPRARAARRRLGTPKWDGFRCIAFRNGGEIDLRSRNDRPLARYFPELCEALAPLPEPSFVLDGEIVLQSDAASAERRWSGCSALRRRLYLTPRRRLFEEPRDPLPGDAGGPCDRRARRAGACGLDDPLP